MDAVLDLTIPTVFIDAHGIYLQRAEYRRIPPGMTVIETALPTQETFARIAPYIHALFVDPKPLVYLFYPDMTITAKNKFDTYLDQVVNIQQAVIKGNYDKVIEIVGLGENPILLKKLEVLESVMESITIYTDEDTIRSRKLTFFAEGTIDNSCRWSASQDVPINWEGFPTKIKTAGGTTSAAIITELTPSVPVKLIILSCGSVSKGLPGFDLANEIMPIREKFWAERDSRAGPPSTHRISKGAYSTHEWCLNGDRLKRYIKDIAAPAGYHNAAVETQQSLIEEDYGVCSSKFDVTQFGFIFVNTGGLLKPIGEDEYSIAPGIENPFIFTTLNNLLLTYMSIIPQLYMIDRSTMNLIKVTDVLKGYIEPVELIPDNGVLIDIYMSAFNTYIMNKYHMPDDREAERPVPSFKKFKDELGSLYDEASATRKLRNDLHVMADIPTILASLERYRGLPIVDILQRNAIDKKDKISEIIDAYLNYMIEDIEYWCNTKLGLPFNSSMEQSGDPIILEIKAKSDAWRSSRRTPRVLSDYADPNPSGKRKASGGFRITRKKSRKGRKTRGRSRSRK